MFNIGKFSQLVRVSPRMLRHYEKCGLFYPAEIDKVNGYRLYSATQIPLLLRITSLRDMGFSIEEIRDILDNHGENDYIEKALQSKSAAIEESIAEENRKMERLKATQERIEKGNYTVTCGEVVLKEIAPQKLLSLRETVPDYSYQTALWERLFGFIQEKQLQDILEGRVMAIYHERAYKETDIDIEVAVFVKKMNAGEGTFIFRETEAVLAAAVVCDGSYEKTLPEGEALLAKWVESKGYEIVGSERAIGIRHPYNEQDPNRYQTEIQFPVRKEN